MYSPLILASADSQSNKSSPFILLLNLFSPFWVHGFDWQVPFSMTHMIDVIVEEMESPDSDNGANDADPVPYHHYTLVMKSLKQPANTKLLIESKEEKVPSFNIKHIS